MWRRQVFHDCQALDSDLDLFAVQCDAPVGDVDCGYLMLDESNKDALSPFQNWWAIE